MSETKNSLKVTLPSDLEIVLTRTFNAPRHLVFEAMIRPEHVTKWWGLRGTLFPICEMDVRPGGTWRYVLVMPNGHAVKFRGVYHEIVAPERIVATECFDEPSLGSPEWHSTVTLEEHDGKTTMISRVLHKSKEARDGHIGAGMEPGAAETFDRLEELVHAQITGESLPPEPMEREIEIIRVFDAPRELVYRAWTEPQHLVQWWGPGMFTNHSCEVDLRAGGAWQIVMRGPDGTDYPTRGVYRETVRPERLVFTNNAYDQSGNQLLEGLTTVVLTEHEGKTKMTLRTAAKGLVPFAPMMLKGMEPGWNQSLDSLTEHLSVQPAVR